MPEPTAPKSLPVADDREYLDMPAERRVLATAHAALLAKTAREVACELPLGADIDDFRRVLAAEAKP